MIYRTVAIFIVLFWLTMTGLLVHQEMRPGDSALREVPPAHVGKLLFMHHQLSTLNIYSDKLRLGQLIIDPRPPEGEKRDLKFGGEVQIHIPGAKRERIGWEGHLHMDKLLSVEEFELTVFTHLPTDLESKIVIAPKENVAHYELRASHGTVERQDYTLDERGARAALQQLGLDPSYLPISKKQTVAAAFEIKARQSTLALHGEQMDTYLVTLESNGQTLLECHVDQLGRIVRANTLVGYTLTPDEITP